MTTTASAIDLPPEKAIEWLRAKVNTTSSDWTTVWQRANARAFTVAGAATDALVEDFRTSVAAALENGTTLADFRKEFDTIAAKHGWVHSGTPAFRAQMIFETNLSMAYSAGRYAEQVEPAVLEAYPYWQYVHSGSLHPRHQHLAWDGLILRADDPWWSTHYPPNGWRCGCWIRPVSARDLARMGRSGPDNAPKIEYRDWTNRKTGEVHKVPVGIDPGFDYNPGEEWQGKAKIPDYATLKAPAGVAGPRALPAAPKIPAEPKSAGSDAGPVTIEPAGPPIVGTPIPAPPATPEIVRQFADDALSGRFANIHDEMIVARLNETLAKVLQTDARDVMLTPWRVRKVAGLAGEHGGLPSNAHPEVTPELWSRLGDLIHHGKAYYAPPDGQRHRYNQLLIHGDVDGRQMMAVVRVAEDAHGVPKLIVPTYHEVGQKRLKRVLRGMAEVGR